VVDCEAGSLTRRGGVFAKAGAQLQRESPDGAGFGRRVFTLREQSFTLGEQGRGEQCLWEQCLAEQCLGEPCLGENWRSSSGVACRLARAESGIVSLRSGH